MKCASRQDLLSYVARTLPPERVAAIDEHAAGCDRCARVREELVAMTRRMASDPGEFDDPALADDVLTLIRLGREKTGPESRDRHLLWRLAPVAAAAAAVLVLVLWLRPSPDPEDFRIRGGAEDPDRWVSIEVFKPSAEGYQAAGTRMQAKDALAFSYENRSANYAFLMVLAVDPRGEVFWFFPAHTREDQDPESIAIRTGSSKVQLPDEVRHDLNPGPLRLFAVFSESRLRVKAVEESVVRDLAAARSLADLERLDIPGTGQHTMLMTVEAGK